MDDLDGLRGRFVRTMMDDLDSLVSLTASVAMKVLYWELMKRLESIAGDQFLMGMILYDGDHTIQHADQIYSVPLGALWV